MNDGSDEGHQYLTVRRGQPLIGIPFQVGDAWVFRYFTSGADADAFVGRDARIQATLSAIGGWNDVHIDEMLDDLDRIRHRNPPTPLPEPLP